MLGSMIGMLPGTLVYVYLGSLVTTLTDLASGGASGGAAQRGLYLTGLAVTVGVTLYVTRVARRALRDATGERMNLAAAAPAIADESAHADDRAEPGDEVLPEDEHNRALVEQVHPRGWKNPEPEGRYNLVVVGGGTAGLVSAAGGAGLGAKVALIERHLLGGDCLNVGCVPSKALLHAAHVAADAPGGPACRWATWPSTFRR